MTLFLLTLSLVAALRTHEELSDTDRNCLEAEDPVATAASALVEDSFAPPAKSPDLVGTVAYYQNFVNSVAKYRKALIAAVPTFAGQDGAKLLAMPRAEAEDVVFHNSHYRKATIDLIRMFPPLREKPLEDLKAKAKAMYSALQDLLYAIERANLKSFRSKLPGQMARMIADSVYDAPWDPRYVDVIAMVYKDKSSGAALHTAFLLHNILLGAYADKDKHNDPDVQLFHEELAAAGMARKAMLLLLELHLADLKMVKYMNEDLAIVVEKFLRLNMDPTKVEKVPLNVLEAKKQKFLADTLTKLADTPERGIHEVVLQAADDLFNPQGTLVSSDI